MCTLTTVEKEENKSLENLGRKATARKIENSNSRRNSTAVENRGPNETLKPKTPCQMRKDFSNFSEFFESQNQS